MALSPEDVLKKMFKATHLKRGYDETEVDEFLDEVVVELRRLGAECAGLRKDLEECRAGRAAGVPGSVAGATAVEAGAGPLPAQDQFAAEREQLTAELAELTRQVEQRRAEARDAELDDVSVEGMDPTTKDTSRIISLAQRLHDEHVAEGESTKVRLVAEAETYHAEVVGAADQRSNELVSTGQAKHDELVSTGQQQHETLVAQGKMTKQELITAAEAHRAKVLEDLSTRQGSLNGRIEELTFFESEYRGKLRGMLTEQLDRLDAEEAPLR